LLDNYRVKALRLWIHDYRWIHTGIGLLGNGAFLVGSVCFLWEPLKTAGIWLFIIGAAGARPACLSAASVMPSPWNQTKRDCRPPWDAGNHLNIMIRRLG